MKILISTRAAKKNTRLWKVSLMVINLVIFELLGGFGVFLCPCINTFSLFMFDQT